jgi:LDH2 family malate/lactate/ureidoglycolate dehydrogenase
VRLPGEKGHALAERQRAEGVTLHAGIVEALQPWAQKLGVALPRPA